VKAGGALVLSADPGQVASRAAGEALAALGDLSPSFAVLFASAHFAGSARDLVAAVAEQTGRVPLIGCVSDGVIGGAREAESGPAVSLWLAAGLGPVETFSMEFVSTASGGAFGGYRFGPNPAGVHLMICDPFTFPASVLLTHLNSRVPGTAVVGGMASGGLERRNSQLFLDGRVLTEGAVGAYLPRAEIHPLVAQGCRPVGNPYTITQADGNVIFELGGRPPLTRLQELAAALPSRERELLAAGPHLGLLMDEYLAEPRQGDFLIRGIVGADAESGAIGIGGEVEVGQTVQFHARDAQSADEDMRHVLEREAGALGGRRAAGALLFTCNGRGSRMFAQPDHDAGLLATVLGQIPVAGSFCDGELGPVGGRNFLHTFTASIALFPAEELGAGGRLRVAQDAQQVAAGQGSAVGLGPAADGEFREERWVGGNVFQADGDVGGSVEVAADADVADARGLADVLDVVGDLGQRGLGSGVGGLPIGLEAVQLVEVLRVKAAARGLGLEAGRPVRAVLRHEARHERDHADAAVPGQPGQHLVGHIPRVVADRAGAGMREDHRGRGDVQGVAHRGRRGVRQVDQHADPLHLADHVAAEVGQPAGRRLVGGRVGPADVRVVGERHIPHAQRVQHPQRAERARDRVAALGAEQRGDPAGREDPLHVGGGQRELQRPGIAGDHRAGQVDLLEHRGDRLVAGQRGGDIDRPELAADPAGRQPRQVGVRAGHRCG
jgi:small ligand-binding sensory domain FIST